MPGLRRMVGRDVGRWERWVLVIARAASWWFVSVLITRILVAIVYDSAGQRSLP
jgi:hypothetical protein